MSRARLAVLLLSAGLCGCICPMAPWGGAYGPSGYGPGGFGPGMVPCNCGAPPLAGGEGPILDAPPGGYPIPGNGLTPQPGMPSLAAPPRLRPQPLAQPIPAPP